MNINQAFDAIISNIRNNLPPGTKKIYVGKTNDIRRRENEHNNQYDYCKEVAKGPRIVISELESKVIDWLLREFPNLTENKNGGSAGPEADSLYICVALDPDDPEREYQELEIPTVYVE